jgi:hypothetical protein
MDSTNLKQEPLMNLTKLDFFNLALKPDNNNWEKFLEDMIVTRYYSFRLAFVHKNYDGMKYFLNLLEGNFL